MCTYTKQVKGMKELMGQSMAMFASPHKHAAVSRLTGWRTCPTGYLSPTHDPSPVHCTHTLFLLRFLSLFLSLSLSLSLSLTHTHTHTHTYTYTHTYALTPTLNVHTCTCSKCGTVYQMVACDPLSVESRFFEVGAMRDAQSRGMSASPTHNAEQAHERGTWRVCMRVRG